MGATSCWSLILVCSLASVPDLAPCTQDNAVEVMYVPDTFANPVTCFMQGQAYVAESSIGWISPTMKPSR